MSTDIIQHYLTNYDKVKNILIHNRKMSVEQAEDCLHNLYISCHKTTATPEKSTLPQYFNRMVVNAANEYARANKREWIMGPESDLILSNLPSDADIEEYCYSREQQALLSKVMPVINTSKKYNIKSIQQLIFNPIVKKEVLPPPKVVLKPEQRSFKISRDLLTKLAKTHTIDQIRKEYGWSKVTIVKYYKQYDITPKGLIGRMRWK